MRVSDDEGECACDCTNTWPSDLVSTECGSYDEAGAGISNCSFREVEEGCFKTLIMTDHAAFISLLSFSLQTPLLRCIGGCHGGIKTAFSRAWVSEYLNTHMFMIRPV